MAYYLGDNVPYQQKINEMEEKRKLEIVVNRKNKKFRITVGLSTGLIGIITAGCAVAFDFHKSKPKIHSETAIKEELKYAQASLGENVSSNLEELLKILPKGSIIYTDYISTQNWNGREYLTEENHFSRLRESAGININIRSDLSDINKKAVNYVVYKLNEINEKMYTGLPKIEVVYTDNKTVIKDYAQLRDLSNEKQLYTDDRYNIDVYLSEYKNSPNSVAYCDIPNGIIGLDSFDSNLIISDMRVKLMHELMHGLYGLNDMYLFDDNNKNVDTLMNPVSNFHELPYLNDICLIAAKCWNEKLTQKQLDSVKEYLYANYNLHDANNYDFSTYIKDKGNDIKKFFSKYEDKTL